MRYVDGIFKDRVALGIYQTIGNGIIFNFAKPGNANRPSTLHCDNDDCFYIKLYRDTPFYTGMSFPSGLWSGSIITDQTYSILLDTKTPTLVKYFIGDSSSSVFTYTIINNTHFMYFDKKYDIGIFYGIWSVQNNILKIAAGPTFPPSFDSSSTRMHVYL